LVFGVSAGWWLKAPHLFNIFFSIAPVVPLDIYSERRTAPRIGLASAGSDEQQMKHQQTDDVPYDGSSATKTHCLHQTFSLWILTGDSAISYNSPLRTFQYLRYLDLFHGFHFNLIKSDFTIITCSFVVEPFFGAPKSSFLESFSGYLFNSKNSLCLQTLIEYIKRPFFYPRKLKYDFVHDWAGSTTSGWR
jgi:hypothetical protein